jgi:hypothetical protein
MAKRTAVVSSRSFKVSWVMSPERVPRDVLPPGDNSEVEWQLQLEGTAPPIFARFPAEEYRRMLRELDGGNVMVTLSAFLGADASGLVLEKTRVKVERRRGGLPARPQAAPAPQIQVEAVKRLK